MFPIKLLITSVNCGIISTNIIVIIATIVIIDKVIENTLSNLFFFIFDSAVECFFVSALLFLFLFLPNLNTLFS